MIGTQKGTIILTIPHMEYYSPKEDVISFVLYVVAKYPHKILPISRPLKGGG